MEEAQQLRVVAVSDFAAHGFNFLMRVTVEVDGRPASEPQVRRVFGLARSAGYAALQWQPAGGWQLGLEGRALSRVWDNDLNTDAAAGHATLAATAGYAQRLINP